MWITAVPLLEYITCIKYIYFTGILGPWIESTNDFSNVERFGAKLKDHNSSLEIDKDGMYMIYAQVSRQVVIFS